VVFTFLVGQLWTNYSLIIFLACGTMYLLTLFAFQWRAPASVVAEHVSAD
jgi:hypothetical protein